MLRSITFASFANTFLAIAMIGSLALTSHADEAIANPLPVLNRIDRNHDGLITVDEVPERAKNYLHKVASQLAFNADETIDLKEVRLAWEAHRRANTAISPADKRQAEKESYDQAVRYGLNLIKLYDTNHNNLLEATEWKQFETAWAEVDANHDSRITLDEMSVRFYRASAEAEREQSNGDEATAVIVPVSIRSRLSELADRELLRQNETTAAEAEDTADNSQPTETYALFLLSRYDKNRDQHLDESEWSELGESWGTIDVNRDGLLSVAEMEIRLKAIIRNKPITRETETLRTGLLADLPQRFFELDANQDKQVQMHEFATDWNAAKLAEFASFDNNNDYVITPREWLTAESITAHE